MEQQSILCSEDLIEVCLSQSKFPCGVDLMLEPRSLNETGHHRRGDLESRG